MSVTIHGDIVSETRNSTRCPGGSGGCQRNALLVTKRGFFGAPMRVNALVARHE